MAEKGGFEAGPFQGEDDVDGKDSVDVEGELPLKEFFDVIQGLLEKSKISNLYASASGLLG